jgi:hypothetical protein
MTWNSGCVTDAGSDGELLLGHGPTCGFRRSQVGLWPNNGPHVNAGIIWLNQNTRERAASEGLLRTMG